MSQTIINLLQILKLKKLHIILISLLSDELFYDKDKYNSESLQNSQ